MMFAVFFSIALFKGIFVVIMKLTQKDYLRSINDSFYFLMLTSFFHLIFLFILPPYYIPQFGSGMLLYPSAFSVSYLMSYAFILKSFKSGPASLGSIIQNFSMIVPIVLGLIIWNEKIFKNQIFGLVLFVLILYLFNSGKYTINNETGNINLKWSILVLAATLFSGLSIFLSKQFSMIYPETPKVFLFIYNFLILAFGLVYFIYLKLAGRYEWKFDPKLIMYSAASALLLCGMNILYMQNVSRFDSAYFFPMLSIGGIVSIIIFSRLILKESGTVRTYMGIALSFAAILLLSLKG